MSSTKGYQSPVQLGLPSRPAAKLQETDWDLQNLYSAVHSLAVQFGYMGAGQAGINPGSKPWQSAGPQFFMWDTCGPVAIPRGSICCPYQGNLDFGSGPEPVDGFILGSLLLPGPGGIAYNHAYLAITDGVPGEKFQVAIGPMVINLTGVLRTNQLYSRLCEQAGVAFNDGSIYTAPSGTRVTIGIATADDTALIYSSTAVL